VVASNVGGIPEIVENEKNGYLIEKDDRVIFSKMLKYLSEECEVRKKMGKEGYEIINKKFNSEKIVNQIDELYTKILEGQ